MPTYGVLSGKGEVVPALQYDLQVTACDRRAVTYDHSEMHRLQADQAVQLLQPQVGPKLSVSLRMPGPVVQDFSAGYRTVVASRTPELVRGSELGADATQIGKIRLSRLLLPR
jgi:hypothetical protein